MATLGQARKRELSRDYETLPARLRRKGEVIVASGFGVQLAVERRRLVITDGTGRNRRQRTFARTARTISRIVVLSGSGTVSIAALRWATDLGIPILIFDRDGRLLSASAPGSGDARLRRAQALAPTTDVGVDVARHLLTLKLTGQRRVLEHVTVDPQTAKMFDDAHLRLCEAGSIDELVATERDAALVYWQAWADIQMTFHPSDLERVPEHWSRFGQRTSPLTGSPRSAVNPANAILNYLYSLLEAETQTACQIVGLDPLLGIVHADHRSRPSLALDLMEAVRPDVDAYLLDLLGKRRFRAVDFHETRQGGCRLLAPLTHELAETLPRWAQLIAPAAEHIAALLANSPDTRVDRLPTPLTAGNRRDANQPRRRPRNPWPPVPLPACKRCGKQVPNRDRTYCNTCAALPQEELYAPILSPVADVPLEAVRRHSDGEISSSGTKRCKRCGRPVSHRKRVLCDPCFVDFRAELSAQRRPCKNCGQPVPHRKRSYCDDCLATRSSSRR